ncbi:myocardin isoform X4 [Dunckerocampus dactyliophorus]|uniref:myocardin isoform X4 n=1 Tax=Dunckerocampus dactyliophorus TaxID=161453 RepID=UPI002405403B|nr:myocardin isoform X4 [Dunckerocampus dactyliophorus]
MTLLGSEHSILIRSKFRSVLQLRLQQRRTREQLADQGIMPLNHGKFPKQEDSYAFEEDSSSESLSPDQHHSDESQGSACPSSEVVGSAASSSSPGPAGTQQEGTTRDPPDQSQDEGLSGASNNQATPPIPVPAVVKAKTSDKSRHKKPKDVKPKVKKLKYHQYIPPDQKADKSPPPMDSAYARLLQQQQLFLQLQILSQQKHAHTHSQSQQHTAPMQGQAQQRQPAFSYQPHPQAHMHKGATEQLPACAPNCPSNPGDSNPSSPVKTSYPTQNNISPVKPGPLPPNLDDLKVEELKMQLHKRKRCYGATPGTVAPSQSHNPSMHHQTMMGQHSFEVNIKQEPMSLSSSCPLSSPKHIKSSPGNCMEDMAHCNTMLSSMGGHCGPQCMDSAPSSGSPSAMTAFLSPQGSPQDSPIGKPSGSPQPSSPNNAYMLSPLVGRDGCGHPDSHCSTRACNMQVPHKSAQPVNCSYPSEQRGVQGLYYNTADYGLTQNGLVKPGNLNIQPKQLTRSQQMDELLDVLIESGGYPSLLVPRFHRHYEHQAPAQLHYDHLETLLGPASRGGEGASLKMATEEGQQEDAGNRDSEAYSGPHDHQRHPHHPQQDKVGINRDLVDTPLSPLNKGSAVPEVQGMVSMAFSETPWETMEWLDLTSPTSTAAFNVPTPSTPSIFNTEFLDVSDINLNSAMDLHLEHW